MSVLPPLICQSVPCEKQVICQYLQYFLLGQRQTKHALVQRRFYFCIFYLQPTVNSTKVAGATPVPG